MAFNQPVIVNGKMVWGDPCGARAEHTEDGYPTAFCLFHTQQRADAREKRKREQEMSAMSGGGQGHARTYQRGGNR
jgi:hypothetical protein